MWKTEHDNPISSPVVVAPPVLAGMCGKRLRLHRAADGPYLVSSAVLGTDMELLGRKRSWTTGCNHSLLASGKRISHSTREDGGWRGCHSRRCIPGFRRCRAMRAFINFEASSRDRHGYPIEVAWVFEDGGSESFLILPIEEWTDWEPAAEAIHGISREQLTSEGVPTDIVAKRLLDELQGHEVFTSAPSWNGRWLSALLQSAGLPRHAISLTDTDAGLLELAGALLAPFVPSSEIHRATRKILAYVADRFADRRHAHRALPDAQLDRERWLMVSELAHAHGKGAEVIP